MSHNDKFEHDIFLSYNRADEEWTRQLATRLERETYASRKLKVFFAPWDIRPGQFFPKEIENGLVGSRKLGLIMSPDAMKSAWVELERMVITYISITERDYRLIPLYRRDCEIPMLLSSILHIDFRDDSKFEESYSTLLAVIRDEPLPRGERELSVLRPLPTQIPRSPTVGFVPRQNKAGEDLVQKIVNMLAPEQNQLVALCGRGGLGKTTLAVEAIKEMRKAFGNRIAWTSADGRKDFSISTLLDDIASQFGRVDLRPLPTEVKKEAVRAVLAEKPALVVLDNFETVAKPERDNCLSWLAHSALFSVLITTREKTPPARYFPVDPMLIDEAQDFCKRLIEQADEPGTFSGLDTDKLIEIAEYNPLIIGWIVGQIDLAQSYDEILNDLSYGKGEAVERVFDRSFELEQLTDDGRDTLLALSLFAPSASRTALAAVAGFGGDADRLNKALSRLAALRMVKSINAGNRLSVEGLTRDFAAARLAKDTRADEFHHRFTQYFLSYSEERRKHNPENHNALESEKDNLLSAIDAAFAQQDWQIVMDIVASAVMPPDCALYLRGYWSEAIRCNEQALQAARNSQSDRSVAIFAHNLAIAHQNRGEFEEARKLYKESLEIKKILGIQRGIATTLHQLGRLAQDQGKIGEARKLYNESLEISKKLGIQSGIAITLHELGRLAQDQGKIGEARKLYNESLEISKKLANQSGIATTLHQLAVLAQKQGDLGEARKLYNESLEINKKLANQSGIATTLHQLAMLAQDQDELDGARTLYNGSLEINKKLGNQYGIAATLGQLGRLAEDEGNKEEAAQLYNDALIIFEKLRSPYAALARKDLERVTN